MTPRAETLARARSLHRSGNPGGAESLYRQLPGADPDNAELWLLLGLALEEQKRFAEAAGAFRQALRVRPSATAHDELGRALAGQGQRDEAAGHYRQALVLQPDHVEALSNLGIRRRSPRYLLPARGRS
jgi:Flp pilus assembly protein TadD